MSSDKNTVPAKKIFTPPTVVSYGTAADLAKNQGVSSMNDIKGILASCIGPGCHVSCW